MSGAFGGLSAMSMAPLMQMMMPGALPGGLQGALPPEAMWNPAMFNESTAAIQPKKKGKKSMTKARN